MRKICSLIAFSLAFLASAQIEIPKDDPHARSAYEFMRTKNPVTNEIPDNIHLKEARFMQRQAERSRSNTATATVWENRGPYNVGGRTRALAIDISDNTQNTILAGGVSGGLWKTTDGGSSWSKNTTPTDIQSITCIVQDTRSGHQNVWYYGTGEFSGNSASEIGAMYSGDGIFKSTDGGDSWSVLPATATNKPQELDQAFDQNHELVVNPQNGDVLVANIGGIYRSQNGGTSFTKVLDAGSVSWTEIAVTSTGILYAAMESGIHQSTDNGDNWDKISNVFVEIDGGKRAKLAIAPSSENIVYLIMETDADHELWKFNDADDTWTDLSANIPRLGGKTGDFDSQGGYNLLIKVKDDDANFVVIGGTNLFRSTDGFASKNNTNWIGGYTPANNSFKLYSNHHPDQHAFIFLANNKALSGNDGGVQITTNIKSNLGTEAVSWNSLNNGYLTSQIYAVSAGPEKQLMIGLQDNGTWYANNQTTATSSWSTPFGGDGSYSAINHDGTHRYVSSQRANIYRLDYTDADDESENSFALMTPSSSSYEAGLFITPFYLDGSDENMLYLGGDNELWVNTQASTGDENKGWKSINLPGASGIVSEIGVGIKGVVYVGTSKGDIIKVSNMDASPAAENLTGDNFPSEGYISGIDVNPFNNNKVLVSFSNYEIPSVFYTSDGGETWTDVSGNLEENPDGTGSGPSVRIARIHGNNTKFYVGTSTGLYSTSDLNGASTIWEREDANGIGNAVVEHMITRLDGLVVAATHGNGVYSANVEMDNTEVPAIITLSNNTIVENQAAGTKIGVLEVEDQDDETHEITLVDGNGGDDNGSFKIVGTDLVTTSSFDFEGQNVYTVRVQAEDDDGNAFAKFFKVEVTDVVAAQKWEEYGITVYPNPAKGRVTMEMVNEYVGNIAVSLFSMDGKELLIQDNYNKTDKSTRSLLDISTLKAGIYFITFHYGDQEVTTRLIKE